MTRQAEEAGLRKLDAGAYANKVKKATSKAVRALPVSTVPALSLTELRIRLARELNGVSLSEVILEERRAGW